MNKVVSFLATFSILMAINFGFAHLIHANMIDLSFPIGLLGILILAPNNPMTHFFNSKITIDSMDMKGRRPGHQKFGKIPIYASIAYTIFGVIITYFYYRSYF